MIPTDRLYRYAHKRVNAELRVDQNVTTAYSRSAATTIIWLSLYCSRYLSTLLPQYVSIITSVYPKVSLLMRVSSISISILVLIAIPGAESIAFINNYPGDNILHRYLVSLKGRDLQKTPFSRHC